MTRNDRIFADIDTSGLGLEIGPSYNPVAPKRAGFKVEIVDHLDRAGLVEKYTAHGVDVGGIEEVDYVWQGQPLSALVGQAGRYDWIIASHVIEHVPDVVGFLNECRTLLKPGGTLSLAVPDKRFCFDYFRPLSTTGEALQAHAEGRTRHPPAWVFDYFSSAARLGDAITWAKGSRGALSQIHSIEEAHRFFAWSRQDDAPYIDIHAWRFTPTSFRLLLQDLRTLGVTELAESSFFDSVGCEFFVSLRPDAVGLTTSRLELSRQVMAELAATVV
jgi:predicted SAM-dependent methyltransferase